MGRRSFFSLITRNLSRQPLVLLKTFIITATFFTVIAVASRIVVA